MANSTVDRVDLGAEVARNWGEIGRKTETRRSFFKLRRALMITLSLNYQFVLQAYLQKALRILPTSLLQANLFDTQNFLSLLY